MEALAPDAIRRAFVNSSKSRAAAMNLPRPWPVERLDDLDFLGWTDPKAPQRAYLVVAPPLTERLVTIELRMADSVGPRRRTMCDWCHTQDAVGGSRLVVAPRAGSRGRSGNSVGLYVCTDFGCSLRARQPLKAHQRSVSGAADRRVDDLRERVAEFVERVLEVG